MNDINAKNLILLNEGKFEDLLTIISKISKDTVGKGLRKIIIDKVQAAKNQSKTLDEKDFEDIAEILANKRKLLRNKTLYDNIYGALSSVSRFDTEEKYNILINYLSADAAKRKLILKNPENFIEASKVAKVATKFNLKLFNEAYQRFSKMFSSLSFEPLPPELKKLQDDIFDIITSMPKNESNPLEYINNKLKGSIPSISGGRVQTITEPYASIKNMKPEELNRNINEIIKHNKKEFRKIGVVLREFGVFGSLKEVWQRGKEGAREKIWALVTWLADRWLFASIPAYRRGEIGWKGLILPTAPFFWYASEDIRDVVGPYLKGLIGLRDEISANPDSVPAGTDPDSGSGNTRIAPVQALSDLVTGLFSFTSGAAWMGRLARNVARETTGIGPTADRSIEFQRAGEKTASALSSLTGNVTATPAELPNASEPGQPELIF